MRATWGTSYIRKYTSNKLLEMKKCLLPLSMEGEDWARYEIHLKSTTCGAGSQWWAVSVSVSHSKHLFLTRLSTNGRERLEPIGCVEVTWWWWDSSARQSYITRPYIGIFHSSGRCRAEPGLFLVQGPCQVFGISASRERPGLTTTSTTTWGREKI